MLALQVERHPAGDQHRELRTIRQQIRHIARRRDDLLEVVQQQQRLPWPQNIAQHLPNGTTPRILQPEGLRDGWDDQRRIGQAREADEPDAIGELLHQFRRNLQAQPCLARAADSGECHQPHPVAPQQIDHAPHGLFPPDERSGLHRQIVGMAVERLERREVIGQSRHEKLVEPLRLPQILEPVLAQVVQGGCVWQCLVR
jgi:hypothetical protein